MRTTDIILNKVHRNELKRELHSFEDLLIFSYTVIKLIPPTFLNLL